MSKKTKILLDDTVALFGTPRVNRSNKLQKKVPNCIQPTNVHCMGGSCCNNGPITRHIESKNICWLSTNTQPHQYPYLTANSHSTPVILKQLFFDHDQFTHVEFSSKSASHENLSYTYTDSAVMSESHMM